MAGGSRGLGLGVVEALASRGAELTVIARDPAQLSPLAERLGVRVQVGDVTDAALPERVLRELRPELVILSAGLPPPMGAVSALSWEDFSAPWNHDVKAGLSWVQAALRAPLMRGGRLLLTSSGAALHGSPLSGGYAGAKRMLWFLAQYANAQVAELGLGFRVQVLVPRQMVGGTGTGDAGARAYAAKRGVSEQEFLATFGTAMPPRVYGELVAELLADPARAQGTAFGLKADTGITLLDAP